MARWVLHLWRPIVRDVQWEIADFQLPIANRFAAI
jgi:hypothetical protein